MLEKHIAAPFGVFCALGLFAVGCDDRSVPPARSSPEPEVSSAVAPSSVLVDRMRPEPTFYDYDAQRVFRLRGGIIEPVQDRTLSEVPSSSLGESVLRVFDDGSIAIVADNDLYLYPVGAPVVIEEIAGTEVALDGQSIDDLWYVSWFLADDLGYRLCHRTAAGTDCNVPVPNEGGYSARLAVATDGSVLVTDRNNGVLRFAGGVLTSIGSIEGGVRSFHRSGDSVLALASPGLYAVEGESLRQLDSRYVSDVVGTAEEYYVLLFDSELVKVDPNCSDSFFTSCERRILWSQDVFERVRDGGATEIGHETCDDTRSEICARTFFGIGIDGDSLVVLGEPIRTLAR